MAKVPMSPATRVWRTILQAALAVPAALVAFQAAGADVPVIVTAVVAAMVVMVSAVQNAIENYSGSTMPS